MKPSEISFIVNIHNTTLASYLYDNLNHSRAGINHIDKNTKLVIFYCHNRTRQKVYRKAKRLGIHEKIIYIQPQGIEHKLIAHHLLDGKVNQPESKYYLDPEDNLSDYIIKPPLGGFSIGIDDAKGHQLCNKFFQKRINKVREFRIIWCSWFTDRNECMIFERLPKNEDMITWNSGVNGGVIKVHPYNENNPILVDLVDNGITTLNTLKLDYMAADFVLDDKDTFWFLEANWMTNYDDAKNDVNMKLVTEWHVNLFTSLFSKDLKPFHRIIY